MKNKTLRNIFCVSLALGFSSMAGLRAQQKENSLVNVAFGKVARQDLLGAVSSVNVSELMKKNNYVSSREGLESFVGGYNNGNIWGQSALVLVDGIPRRASDVSASEIESITVLKGSNAIALYGSQAAKGVILITTKRGTEKPLSLDVRANTGVYLPKGYPEYLGSAEYMTLYNKACVNDGVGARYKQDEIDNTAAGTNPYKYPDIDFFGSDYLKKAYYKTDLTGEISGGNDKNQFYTNFGMSYNNSLMNYGKQADNNDLSFNIRSNVDMELTDWLKASADASVNIYNSYRGAGDFWGSSATLRPNALSPLIPVSSLDPASADMSAVVANTNNLIDGKYLLGGNDAFPTNPFGDMLAAGYSKQRARVFMFNVNMEADMGNLLKGLRFKSLYGVDYTTLYSEDWVQSYATYAPTWYSVDVDGPDADPNMLKSLKQYGVDGNTTNESIGLTYYTQTLTFNSQFNYNRSFAERHNVSAALIGWGYQQQFSDVVLVTDAKNKTYHRSSNVNLGMQAAYNYQHRYYFDFSGALVHSAKLPENNRRAFSPSFTLGWRISDENFFKNNVSFVNDLKLTASYANLNQDIDISEYYMYKGYFDYSQAAGWYQWRDGLAGGATTGSKRANNYDLTYIQREEYRVGLETALFDNLVTFDANYFLQYTKGGLADGAQTIYPSYFKGWDFSFLPNLNFNEDKREGVDFALNLNRKVGQVDLSLGFVGMYFSSEALKRDEVFDSPELYRTGQPLDGYWGYVSEGLFKDDADIQNHQIQKFGDVKPGDIKYKDVNSDGVVDTKDQVNLGHNGWSVSPFTYGLNLTVKWKNLTFFAMGAGSTGAIAFKNSSYYWVKGNDKYSAAVRDHWTGPEDVDAKFPRLTTTSGSNNFRNSSFWMYKTDRFDLKRIQMTYDFPKAILGQSLVKDLSVYVSGDNLLTLSKERKLMETNIGEAPQYRFINLGLKAKF